ncbi:hypothetical protein K449DRAFT_464727 [Hypoxylon sp. EC38]|nr:hypothetical protein K449DRAFT_464727 [Hypoxylon sp. EC38]
MRFLVLLLALGLFILAYATENNTAAATTDKPDTIPAISPPYNFNDIIEPGLQEHLNATSNHVVFLPAGQMPEYCMDEAKENGYGPADIEAFEAHYDDCHIPWVMCRLKTSKIDACTIAEFFGKMPLGMREFVRHIIVLKPKDLHGAAALSRGDNIEVSEDSWRLYILAHEMSHSLDSHISIPGVTQTGQGGLSASQTWKLQFSQDSATVTEYARTLWSEDLAEGSFSTCGYTVKLSSYTVKIYDPLAETGILALYDTVVPGGVATLSNSSHSVYHQYTTYQKYYGDIITPGRKSGCTSRLPDSQMVTWDDSGSRIAPSEYHPKAKVGVTVIPPGIFHNETCILPP